jgi:hypothetical protein
VSYTWGFESEVRCEMEFHKVQRRVTIRRKPYLYARIRFGGFFYCTDNMFS